MVLGRHFSLAFSRSGCFTIHKRDTKSVDYGKYERNAPGEGGGRKPDIRCAAPRWPWQSAVKPPGQWSSARHTRVTPSWWTQVAANSDKGVSWPPERSELARASLWEHSDKRLALARKDARAASVPSSRPHRCSACSSPPNPAAAPRRRRLSAAQRHYEMEQGSLYIRGLYMRARLLYATNMG